MNEGLNYSSEPLATNVPNGDGAIYIVEYLSLFVGLLPICIRV
jgi:hypothetical protein